MRSTLVLSVLGLAALAGCDSPASQSSTATPTTQSPNIPPPPPGAAGSAPAPAAQSTELTAREKRAGFSMKTYAGKQPVLLVFNKDEGEWYQKFSAAVNELQGEVERHGLVVIEVLETDRAYPRGRIRGGESLSEEAATNLADGYNGGGGSFKLVLVGKDGQVIEHMGYTRPADVLAKLSPMDSTAN